MRSSRALSCLAGVLLLSACGNKPMKPSELHLQRNDAGSALSTDIPPTIKNSIPLAPPKPAAKVETYSVVVTNVPVQEILFALARDARVNLDIRPGIEGRVSLNALDQTLPQILDRIGKQVDMRYELQNGTLLVEPDKPFLKTYKVDFINMTRTVNSTMFTSSQIGAAGAAATGTAGGVAGGPSGTSVKSESKNDLMDSLVENIRNIIVDEDKFHYQERMELQSAAAQEAARMANPAPSGTPAAPAGQAQAAAQATKGTYERAVNVFANKETGVIIVRATSRQHEKVQEFIDKVMSTARRQVLIEATIAEVTLNKNYQQGVNWSRLLTAGPGNTKGFQLTQAPTGNPPATNTASIFLLNYLNPTSKFGNLSASVQLLESFGDVKVLSSPKLSVMNNQTATLKVVDNRVYFTIQAQTTIGTVGTPSITNFTTTPNTVAVGFVMNVTPQISDVDTVTMNVRPIISRIIDYVNDPNPNLSNPCGVGVTTCNIPPIVNRIPEVQTREMESIIKVNSGQIAVLGGLMQDGINNLTDSVPLLGNLPLIGNLFKNRNDTSTKTELVIFLRPTVVKEASINGDYREFRDDLPDGDFLKPGEDNQKSSTSTARQ